jgi:hypothetical protein
MCPVPNLIGVSRSFDESRSRLRQIGISHNLPYDSSVVDDVIDILAVPSFVFGD